MFKKIAILGPGLLGGSIGMAVCRRKIAKRVVIWGRRLEVGRLAVKRGAAHEVANTPEEAVVGADLVVLCTPVETMPELARRIKSHVSSSCLVTDVGSTKYDVVKQLTAILSRKAVFVGSHPMAGAEKDGILAARANLFAGTVCVLTPLTGTKRIVLKKLSEFWEKLGCSIQTMDPAEHDEVVACISHVPHLAAAALVRMVSRKNPAAFHVIGNGFRDTTRIASGPAEMWSGIVMSNREEIQRGLKALIEELEAIRRDTINGSAKELADYLAYAKRQRDEKVVSR